MPQKSAQIFCEGSPIAKVVSALKSAVSEQFRGFSGLFENLLNYSVKVQTH